MRRLFIRFVILAILALAGPLAAAAQGGNYLSHTYNNGVLAVQTDGGTSLQVQLWDTATVRVSW